ncbi:HAD hydrolase family protein [Bacillus sp. EB600]|uniref:HAD family hydrolase n=1 Tax=Bacillus sp. EB600 TaxID=2806345 RepID=UPI0021094F16|nr:HAD hydrolase family protein [Bacillus sp. EB600]MCQ6281384.1 HAD hydrolase family protein [Bacillus sp. EB600]
MPNCDVILSNTNKAVGLTKLLEQLGIAPGEAVAFGDGQNDIEMLSLVGMGVARKKGQSPDASTHWHTDPSKDFSRTRASLESPNL